MFELRVKQGSVQHWDNVMDTPQEPMETIVEILARVKEATNNDFKLTHRQIVWYAEIGLIGKSIREHRIAKYPARTSRDLTALWVLRMNIRRTKLTELTALIKSSKARLYEIIETLQMMDILLMEYLWMANPVTNPERFVQNNKALFKLKDDFFQKLHYGVHPLHIILEIDYKYFQDTRTTGQPIRQN